MGLTLARESGLGKAKSQKNAEAWPTVLARLMESDRFGACLRWASQMEGQCNNGRMALANTSIPRVITDPVPPALTLKLVN